MEPLHRIYHKIRSISRSQAGASLVEMLLAIGLAGALMPALLTGFVTSKQGKVQQESRREATSMLREAQEAVRSVRERGWTAFAVNGTYHPAVVSGVWQLQTGTEMINGYTKSIVISDLYRNSLGEIVSSGGTLDPSSKQVMISVGWETPYSNSVSSTLYITRYLDNALYTQSTQTEFATGSNAGTVITNTSGGEVSLGAGGGSDWCNPDLTITALDLPKNGVANAINAISGQLVAGTGDNASGVSFANVTVSNDNPPTSSIAGTFDGYKTNAVFTETNYAYLGTDTNSKEVVILDLTSLVNGKYSELGYFNAPGSSSGTSVAVSGNVGFMVSGSTLYSFDLTSKSGARSQLASKTLPGNGTKIVIMGSEAYVSIASTSKGLQIVHFDATGTTLTDYGYATVNGQNATDVSVNSTGTRAYLSTGADASKPEFFILDTSLKSSANPSLPTVGTYDTAGMDPKGINVVTGNKAIIVGHSGQEYQVINIASESTPVQCGGLQIDSGVNGISSVIEQDNDAYSYIITGDSSSELKIIQGGPGGEYTNSGTYTSAYFEPGYKTAFNRFFANSNLPSQTDVTFQVGIADSQDCTTATYTYIGPDGTGNTFFPNTGGSIPFDSDGVGYENPGTCFRYKAFLSSEDVSAAPEFLDITVNYSP